MSKHIPNQRTPRRKPQRSSKQVTIATVLVLSIQVCGSLTLLVQQPGIQELIKMLSQHIKL